MSALFLHLHLSRFLSSLSLCLLGLRLGEVVLVVEVTEENDEAQRVGEHDHVHGVREVTVDKHVEGGVEGYYDKLELGGRQTDGRTDRQEK